MDDARVKALLSSMRTVAVVGLSPNPERASHGIAKFLIGAGFDVVGVNPGQTEILGVPVYPTLAEVPHRVDLVDVFRRSDTVVPVVQAAITRGDGFIWLQEGVVNDEAAALAERAGIPIVMDRCVYKEWLRLMNA
jgi:predicted CoA-binding protein